MLLCAAPLHARAADEPPSAAAILSRVKAAFRARPQPPFVAYTLERRDTIDGRPDFENSYTLRIWCRTSDRAALARRVRDGRASGEAHFIRPAFDEPIDPGPPTADVFASLAPRAAPEAGAAKPYPRIGSVAVLIERDYVATYAGEEGTDDHVRLAPKRDPATNRLTDIFVDRATSMLTRAVVRDHLYTGGRTVPERFEIVFENAGDTPVISAIHGRTDYAQMDARARGEPLHTVDYRFTAIAFPRALPDWYFMPETYGAHAAELPGGLHM